MISHNIDPECVGLNPGSNLLASLRQQVMSLASKNGVVNTIQAAAQTTLQAGWSVLLPTADERAKTLSSLLPSVGNDSSNVNSGQRFMTDLLVSTLMADEGLETALKAAIKGEIADCIVYNINKTLNCN